MGNTKDSLWFPPLAPLTILFAAITFFAVVVVFTTRTLINQPWPGLSLDVTDGMEGLVVTNVADGTARRTIEVGDRLLAISGGSHRVFLGPLSLRKEPDNAPTYKGYNDCFRHLREINEIPASEKVLVYRAGRRSVSVHPAPSRPLRDIPFTFWLINGFAVIGLLYGSGRVEVGVRSRNDGVRIELLNHGITKAPESWTEGTGIASMKTRPEGIGAEIGWESRGGSAVAVVIDLPDKAGVSKSDRKGDSYE